MTAILFVFAFIVHLLCIYSAQSFWISALIHVAYIVVFKEDVTSEQLATYVKDVTDNGK